MDNCTTVKEPILVAIEDPCKGKRTATECVYSKVALPGLSLPENATAEEIITALLLVINNLEDRVNLIEGN